MAKQDDIRPIYYELRGCYEAAPSGDKTPIMKDENIWEHVNRAIDELDRVSGKDYNQFKMVPQRKPAGLCLDKDTYRNKLAALISRLYGEYFQNDELPPFSNMPSTIISQTQMQSQTQTQMLFDFRDKIDEQLRKLEPGDKRHTFLEKVKGALASVKDYAGLLALCVTTAKECGLTLEEISRLFN